MADPAPPRPHLASVKDPVPESAAPAQAKSPATARRSPVFWLLALLAAIASIAFGIQTERVRVLQASNAGLQGALFSTRTKLAAYTNRFAVVRDTVAGLQAQIDELNALVTEEPVAPAPDAAVPAPSAAAAPSRD